MPTTNYSFTNPANYTFDPVKVEVTGGVAQLKLVVAGGQVFNEDFINDTGFTYDNTKAEFVAGAVQQKDVTPLNSLFAVSYDTNANPITNEADLNWRKAGGSLNATLNGAPTIVANELVCTGTQGVYYQCNSHILESHKFQFSPNYTTSPPANINLVSGWNGSLNDRFTLTHSPSGNNLRFTLNNDIGGVVYTTATAFPGSLWEPTAGQKYEFLLTIDSVTGVIKVFIDGVLHGTLSPGAWTRGTGVMRYYMGASPIVYDRAEGSFDDYISFEDIQETISYTPGYTIDPFLYVESEVELPVFTHIGLGTLISLEGILTTEGGSPRYSFEAGSFGHVYWNGSAWVASDGSYAQANDVATANTNLPTLDVNGELTFHVHAHFTGTNTQSSVDDLTVNHTGNTIFDITNPTIVPTTLISQDALNSFLATLTAVGSDEVRFALRLDGQDKYWNGAAWVNADGTFAQTNDITTIQTNLATFITRGDILPVIHLHSNDGSTTPNIDELTIDFNFYGGAASVENVCTVWGYLYDELNAPVVGTSVVVTPNNHGLTTDKVINTTPTTVFTDSTGYWEITIVETASDLDNWSYKFEINGFTASKYIPNTTSANFNDLVEAFVGC